MMQIQNWLSDAYGFSKSELEEERAYKPPVGDGAKFIGEAIQAMIDSEKFGEISKIMATAHIPSLSTAAIVEMIRLTGPHKKNIMDRIWFCNAAKNELCRREFVRVCYMVDMVD